MHNISQNLTSNQTQLFLLLHLINKMKRLTEQIIYEKTDF